MNRIRLGSVGLFGSLAFVIALAIPPAAAAPSNDNFEANETLSATATGSVNGTNVDATFQSGTGEPDHAIDSGLDSTVWYQWTAPSAGGVNFCVYGGSLDDSTIGVYTGNTFGALSLVQANDDGPYGMGPFSSVAFSAAQDQTYMIQVGGPTGHVGTFTLKWSSDCTAPETSIASVKAKGGYGVVTFSGTDDTSPSDTLTFECDIDGLGFVSCTTPYSIDLPSGQHTVKVRATDEADNTDVVAQEQTFTIKSRRFGVAAPAIAAVSQGYEASLVAVATLWRE